MSDILFVERSRPEKWTRGRWVTLLDWSLGPTPYVSSRALPESCNQILAGCNEKSFAATLFGDEYFADLYTRSRLGRPTVPARVVATVMVLQAFEGLSDREAVDRLGRDLAWQGACGVDLGYEAFHSTVLVGVRNRLRVSDRPKRFLDDT